MCMLEHKAEWKLIQIGIYFDIHFARVFLLTGQNLYELTYKCILVDSREKKRKKICWMISFFSKESIKFYTICYVRNVILWYLFENIFSHYREKINSASCDTIIKRSDNIIITYNSYNWSQISVEQLLFLQYLHWFQPHDIFCYQSKTRDIWRFWFTKCKLSSFAPRRRILQKRSLPFPLVSRVELAIFLACGHFFALFYEHGTAVIIGVLGEFKGRERATSETAGTEE